MKEIKSTIVGIFLILLGSALAYFDNIDIHANDYVVLGYFGLIVFGIYFLFTVKGDRQRHLKALIFLIKRKVK